MDSRTFSFFFHSVWLLFVFVQNCGLGQGPTAFPQRKFLIYAAGNIALTSTEADSLASATYTQKFRTPLIGVAGFGAYPLHWLWLGVRYENWLAAREFSSEGSLQRDTLYLKTLGPELGYVRGNPRVSYVFAVGGMYPLDQRIESSIRGTFSRGTRFWNAHARASMELKLNTRLNFHLEAGYRWLNLKDLSHQGTSFISGGKDLNLSGPFVGLGLGVMF